MSSYQFTLLLFIFWIIREKSHKTPVSRIITLILSGNKNSTMMMMTMIISNRIDV